MIITNSIDGFICILNIQRGKNNYNAAGDWEESVKILNCEHNVDREYIGGVICCYFIKHGGGRRFLIVYKNGTVVVWNIFDEKGENEEDNIKQRIETGFDINTILFDSKFFEIYAIGTNIG